ncbi:type III-B CRISPR module RAMP protein Cmr4 [Chitinispirillales bacterium ANBcel5]|uniref:type III-B CRISPR module RAMP protein Cmr4 n=1 Tax=Cellulosispirillum alkaliphilum TaxID=3039283 RepID=UPI002A54E4DB|nr:type III-B CRISPR module RAMP protein Cmr4 [Chitinispirillales bacterium ANBcel5]
MNNLLFALRALSPLHCGIGQGLNDIDLPTARHAVSGHPIIPGSSLKGVLKDEFSRGRPKKDDEEEKKVHALFGLDGDSKFASAVSIGDALLLALPVRSFFGTFGYLASPYTLHMLKNQLKRVIKEDILPEVPDIRDPKNEIFKAILTKESALKTANSTQILLEELDLSIDTEQSEVADKWAELIAPFFFDDEGQRIFKKRFTIVDDNALNFLADTALPVDARIAINYETGTVEGGALWYEETVSPETLFTGIVTIDRSYNPEQSATADELKEVMTGKGRIHCQIGGKATTGKGFVAIGFKDSKSLEGGN